MIREGQGRVKGEMRETGVKERDERTGVKGERREYRGREEGTWGKGEMREQGKRKRA